MLHFGDILGSKNRSEKLAFILSEGHKTSSETPTLQSSLGGVALGIS